MGGLLGGGAPSAPSAPPPPPPAESKAPTTSSAQDISSTKTSTDKVEDPLKDRRRRPTDAGRTILSDDDSPSILGE